MKAEERREAEGQGLGGERPRQGGHSVTGVPRGLGWLASPALREQGPLLQAHDRRVRTHPDSRGPLGPTQPGADLLLTPAPPMGPLPLPQGDRAGPRPCQPPGLPQEHESLLRAACQCTSPGGRTGDRAPGLGSRPRLLQRQRHFVIPTSYGSAPTPLMRRAVGPGCA